MRLLSARRLSVRITRGIKNLTFQTSKKVVFMSLIRPVRRRTRRRAICLVLILSLLCLPGSNYAYSEMSELTGGLR